MPRPQRPTIEGKRQKQEDTKERKSRLQREADERQKAYDDLTPKAKLKLLDSRPGESKRQRAKIEAQMAKEKAKPATPPPAPVAAAPATAEPANGKKKSRK